MFFKGPTAICREEKRGEPPRYTGWKTPLVALRLPSPPPLTRETPPNLQPGSGTLKKKHSKVYPPLLRQYRERPNGITQNFCPRPPPLKRSFSWVTSAPGRRRPTTPRLPSSLPRPRCGTRSCTPPLLGPVATPDACPRGPF